MNDSEFEDVHNSMSDVNLKTFFGIQGITGNYPSNGMEDYPVKEKRKDKVQNFISSNDYLSFLKSFGLSDIDFLKPEKTDINLLPSKDILEDLNRDQINSFIRQIAHKIEDVLSCRLTDSEYQKIANIIAAVRERGKTVEEVAQSGSPSAKLKLGFLE